MQIKVTVAELPEKPGDSWNEREEVEDIPEDVYNRVSIICEMCDDVDYPNCMKTCDDLPRTFLTVKMKELGVS